VIAGSPEAVAKSAKSYTGKWLARILQFSENSQNGNP
jgi:excinuclease UvrABC ATPase subunit